MSKAASRLPFLISPPPFSTTPLQATFEHRASPMTAAQGLVDVRFWASREPWEEGSGGRRGVFLFIPGNPGLPAYYDRFLSTLSNLLPPHVAILAIGHLGHAAHLPSPSKGVKSLELGAQVVAKIELVDAVQDALVEAGASADDVQLAVGGHSVGAYMAVEVAKVRPDAVNSLALLFPTLANIVLSPNGQLLAPIFSASGRALIPYFSLPLRLLSPLLPFFLPPPTVALVTSRHVIRAALSLGRSEMEAIRDADVEFLRRERGKIWGYWGKNDGWVREADSEELRAVLGGGEEEDGEVEDEVQSGVEALPESIQRIWHCVEGIPHAFCLDDSHGDVMAQRVGVWLALKMR